MRKAIKIIYELKRCYGWEDTYNEELMYISEDLEALKRLKEV
jgi:hypothetical protein